MRDWRWRSSIVVANSRIYGGSRLQHGGLQVIDFLEVAAFRAIKRADRIAVNCLRIDVPIASEGFVYNAPDLDKSDWEPTEVGAEAGTAGVTDGVAAAVAGGRTSPAAVAALNPAAADIVLANTPRGRSGSWLSTATWKCAG